jgi:Flp pilus assembly pilin Flp
MIKYIKNLVRDEDGVTAVEYAVLAVLMVGGLVTALTTLAPALTLALGKITLDLAL